MLIASITMDYLVQCCVRHEVSGRPHGLTSLHRSTILSSLVCSTGTSFSYWLLILIAIWSLTSLWSISRPSKSTFALFRASFNVCNSYGRRNSSCSLLFRHLRHLLLLLSLLKKFLIFSALVLPVSKSFFLYTLSFKILCGRLLLLFLICMSRFWKRILIRLLNICRVFIICKS